MTTFDQDETGLDTGNPLELYRFYGELGAYTFTSGNRVMNFTAPSANTSEQYAPVPLQRTEIVLGDVTEKNELKVTLPYNLMIFDDYVYDISPTDDLVLEIYRQHGPGGTYRMVFYGTVAGFSVQNSKVTATCPSAFTNYLGSEFPNVFFQSNCNHVLYDARCGLNRDDFKVTARIIAVSADRTQFTFATTGGAPPGLDRGTQGSAQGGLSTKTFNGIQYDPSDIGEWVRYLSDYPDILPEANREVQLRNFPSTEDYAAWHFQAFGRNEGRKAYPTGTPGRSTAHYKIYDGTYYDPSDVACWTRYLSDYPDVAAQVPKEVGQYHHFSSAEDFGAYHYARFGQFEGRTIHPSQGGQDGGFSIYQGVYYDARDTAEWQRYLQDYPDVQTNYNTFAPDLAAEFFNDPVHYAAYHYASSGKADGRIVHPTPGFDPDGTQDNGWVPPDGWLIPGEVVLGSERRLIVNQAGTGVVCNYPFRRIKVGDIVTMYAGCRHNSADCVNKFGNGDSFLGFEYVPYINPFEVGIK